MARPGYFPDYSSFESGVVPIYLQWTSGSSGAVPTTLTRKSQVTSVVHGATGVYVVTFDESWGEGELVMSHSIRQASYSKTGACKVIETANAIATAGTKTITLLVVDGDGDAVEPTTNDVISIKWELQSQKSGY